MQIGKEINQEIQVVIPDSLPVYRYAYINTCSATSPSVCLDGEGSGTESPEEFIEEIKNAIATGEGHLATTYTYGFFDVPEHLWKLVGYEKLTGHSRYEFFFHLVYEPVNPDIVIKDCMGGEEEYYEEQED